MIVNHLPLVLLLSSFISAAAVPSSSNTISDSNNEPSTSTEWSTPDTVSLERSIPRSDDNNVNRLARRRPYYFPETVPDEAELAAHFAALREAGLLPDVQVQQQQGQDQQAMRTPDATIDPDPKKAWPSHIQDQVQAQDQVQHQQDQDLQPASALSERDTPQSLWEAATPLLLPAFWFFVIASVLTCIATVIRGINDKGKH